MRKKFTHDVIVIGGGAAGLTAAGGCALFGLKVALIEAREMGGECLNDGCVPSKALIAAARRAAGAREATRHGVSLAPPEVDWKGVQAHIRGAIAAIAPHDSQERFEAMGCEVVRDWAKLTGRHSVEVSGRTLIAPRIVLATGSRPAVPPIEGVNDVPYLTNETIFDIEELPGHLLIVGGGAAGMEMAQAFRRLGSAVTVIEPEQPLSRDDAGNVAVVVKTMKNEGVRFASGKAVGVSGGAGAIFVALDQGETLSGTHLLIAAGRTVRTGDLGLETVGVETGENGIETDARRRTSIHSIYAIGDCRDGPRLTHVSAYEGGNVALEIALGVPIKVDYTALPWATYTDPELAQIGLTEAKARDQHGDAIRVATEEFAGNDRAVTEGETLGRAKVILKGRKVIGASIVGKDAGDLLLPYSQLITGKVSTFRLGSAIVAYPTRSEISKAVAFALWQPTVFGTWSRRWAGLVQIARKIFA